MEGHVENTEVETNVKNKSVQHVACVSVHGYVKRCRIFSWELLATGIKSFLLALALAERQINSHRIPPRHTYNLYYANENIRGQFEWRLNRSSSTTIIVVGGRRRIQR